MNSASETRGIGTVGGGDCTEMNKGTKVYIRARTLRGEERDRWSG